MTLASSRRIVPFGSPSLTLKPAPGDLLGPDAYPVIECPRDHWPHRPEAQLRVWPTVPIGYVVRDTLHQNAPSKVLIGVVPIDLETDLSSDSEVQFAPRISPKNNDSLIEEVIDGKNERSRVLIDDRQATEVV